MKKEHFEKLVASIKEAGEIALDYAYSGFEDDPNRNLHVFSTGL